MVFWMMCTTFCLLAGTDSAPILQGISDHFESGGEYSSVVDLLQQINNAYRKNLGMTQLGGLNDPNFDPVTAELVPDQNVNSELSKVVHPFLFYEGDIVLTRKQARQILDDTKWGRKKRKVTSDISLRWKNKIVPFQLDPGLSDKAKMGIAQGLYHITSETCLNFQPWQGETDYICFFDGGGCFSNVGRAGKEQGISIGRGCESPGIVAHEVGHALGLWHEQSRADRDDYINVLFGNINQQLVSNFQRKRSSDVMYYDQPYDYGSVMHYGPRGFSTDYWKLRTIETRESKFQKTIGQRESLSFIDLKQINAAYCADMCGHLTNQCTRHGYPEPRNCQKCKCPEGLGGKICDHVQLSTSPSYCGGELVATSDFQYISSPRYPTRLVAGLTCYWFIKAPPRVRIAIEIMDLQFSGGFTCINYVEVKAKGYPSQYSGNGVVDFRQTGMRFCGDSALDIVYSDTNEAIIIMKTKSSGDLGFKLRYNTYGQTKATATTTTHQPTDQPYETATPPIPSDQDTNDPTCWINLPFSHCEISRHPDFAGQNTKSRQHYCICPSECETYIERVTC